MTKIFERVLRRYLLVYHIVSLLLAKAEAFGIRGKIPTWFAFLGNRVQQVRTQGSVLGPGGQLRRRHRGLGQNHHRSNPLSKDLDAMYHYGKKHYRRTERHLIIKTKQGTWELKWPMTTPSISLGAAYLQNQRDRSDARTVQRPGKG